MTNASHQIRLHPRTNPIQIEIDGRTVTAHAGESIAAILMAEGQRIFTEASIYNLDRTLFCCMGTCHQCLVTVNGVQDVRACMTPITAGMTVETKLGRDDSNLAEKLSFEGKTRFPVSQNKQVDVVIIGTGPAGMAAAAELNNHTSSDGLSVLILDAYPQMGGHYYRQPAPEFGNHPLTSGKRQQEFEELQQRATKTQITILHETTVWSVFKETGEQGFEIRANGPEQGYTIHCRVLLGCPGAYDRPFPFPGWHLPGVITLGGAQMLLKGHGILPGQRVLVSGSGPLVLAAAAGLSEAGAEVVAVLDTASVLEGGTRAPFSLFGQLGRLKEGWDYLKKIRKGGAPLKFRHAIFEASGQDSVEAATYGPIDGAGRPLRDQAVTVEVDMICSALGFLPNIALTRLLKCDHFYDARLDAYYPTITLQMETTVPNFFVAGDVTGIGGKDISKKQGQIVAWEILARLNQMPAEVANKHAAPLRKEIAAEQRFLDILCERMRIKPGFQEFLQDDTVICRCEMIDLATIREAIHEGADDLRGIKLRTRCGMGACQSRYCEQSVAQIIIAETGCARDAVGTTSVRPPLIPVPMGHMI